jgi:hypothetical protein
MARRREDKKYRERTEKRRFDRGGAMHASLVVP